VSGVEFAIITIRRLELVQLEQERIGTRAVGAGQPFGCAGLAGVDADVSRDSSLLG